jgi:Ca2+/Na+ antiporter
MLLNDLAWFAFITPVGFVLVQNFCLAMAVYLDKGPAPIFPRWVAHFNIVTALLMAPSAFALMYKTGPLAWDGAISFWLHIATYALYIAVMFFVLRSAVQKQADEETMLQSSWKEQTA